MISINTKFTGYGHYNVIVTEDFEKIGAFDTTDMQLIDDINELNKEGFEDNLVMHDTFEEVEETVLSKIKR